MLKEDSVFKNSIDLAEYLLSLDSDISPIRLQKTLYFLFAFYGAIYGRMNNNNVDEENIAEGTVDITLPEKLFPAKFEAWQFGPVDRDVYRESKQGNLNAKTKEEYDSVDEEVFEFIDNVKDAISKFSDFDLVQRTHQDTSWKNAITPKGSNPSEMDNELIIEEYADLKMRI